MEYQGIDGFLGTRASIMLDVVFLAMFAVLPVLGWSVALARYQRRYQLHKQIQVGLGLVLLVAVLAFEIDMRFLTDWRQRAQPSPYYDRWVDPSLAIHLLCAVPTAFLWVFVIVRALRKFPNPAAPGPHSKSHLFWGRLAALEMVLTAVTGWAFYYLAFAAR